MYPISALSEFGVKFHHPFPLYMPNIKSLKLWCIFLVISQHLRLDKGTETKDIATIHAFLRNKHGDTDTPEDTVHYGPSTSNKVIFKIQNVISYNVYDMTCCMTCLQL